MTTPFCRILVLFLALMTGACNERIDKALPEEGGANAGLACGPTDFATIQRVVLSVRCVACHGSSGGVNLENYAAVKAAIGKVETVIKARTMPKARPLPAAEEALILKWIGEGAPQNASGPPSPDCQNGGGGTDPVTPVKPLAPNYASIRERIFEPKCLTCHDAGSGLYDFSSYPALMADADELFDRRDPEDSDLIEAVTKTGRGAMPPPRSGISPLTREEVQTLLEWIRRGLPETGN
ncbi:MAG: c-type cytochrome [Bdellovibrionaceae bacterium]|nr:c-type cytochrome [Pseudobdellovibrionaceae bacterium]